MEKIFILDWPLVKPETNKLLNNGTARIINGVARNIDDGYKIIQHMPFKEISLKESSDLIKTAKLIEQSQNLLMGAMAVSTVAIMGAVIVSTSYLSKKIDKLQEKIDDIQKELRDQNILFYAEKIAFYFGSIESLRQLISKNTVVSENNDLIINSLSSLLISRTQLLSFVDNLIYLSDSFGEDHKEMVVEFINMTMELIPKGVFIESQAAYKLERFYLGDEIRQTSRLKYFDIIEKYKGWGNNKYKELVRGKNESATKAIMSKIEDIKNLIHSEENKLLLTESV